MNTRTLKQFILLIITSTIIYFSGTYLLDLERIKTILDAITVIFFFLSFFYFIGMFFMLGAKAFKNILSTS